jgi:hypothetical protein
MTITVCLDVALCSLADTANVSEVLAASIIRAMSCRPDDWDSTHLGNVGQFLLDYIAQRPIHSSSLLTA